jgi:hypothetical protein
MDGDGRIMAATHSRSFAAEQIEGWHWQPVLTLFLSVMNGSNLLTPMLFERL